MGCTHVGWCRGGGDPEQPMNNKSWWRCFQSRLSRRVVRSVLFSILGIEILVFIPSYLLKEQTLLQELGDSTRQSLAVAMTSRPAQTQPYTIDQVSQILTQYRLKNSVIQSGVVFDPTGKDLRDFGEPQYLNQLKTSLKTSRKNRQRRFRDQSLIEVVWSPEVLKTDYGVALILNTQSIQRELGQYTLRTLAMVLLITAFVGLVMFLVLQRIFGRTCRRQGRQLARKIVRCFIRSIKLDAMSWGMWRSPFVRCTTRSARRSAIANGPRPP
jgi:hypothetical protein